MRGKPTLKKSHWFERFHILSLLGCAHLLMAHVLYLMISNEVVKCIDAVHLTQCFFGLVFLILMLS